MHGCWRCCSTWQLALMSAALMQTPASIAAQTDGMTCSLIQNNDVSGTLTQYFSVRPAAGAS